MARRPPHCDHAPAGACNVPGCPHAASSRPRPDHQPITRCAESGCPETPTGTRVGNKWFCHRHIPKERPLTPAADAKGTPFPPSAVELWKQIERIPEERAGAFMGLLMRARGNLRASGVGPWWWCYGRQPIFVKGAPWNWSTVHSGMMRVMSESAAAREYFAQAIRDLELKGSDATATRAQLAVLTGMSRSQIRRRQRARKGA